MPDLWEGDMGDVSDFALPGDAETLGEEPAPQDTPAEPESQASEVQQPRDEHGRFVSAAEEEEGEPEQDLAPDDPVARRLAEKEAMIGRQSTEIGELRERERQWAEWYAAQQYQSQQPAAPAGDWDTLIAENPAYATQLAAQQGDHYHYQLAAQEWEEVAPGAPQLWYQQQQIAQQQQMTLGALQSIARERHQQDTGQAVAALAEKYPDLADRIDDMAQIAPEYPFVMRAFASGNPNEVAKAVETLYLNTRGLATDTLAQKAQDTVRKLAEDEQRAVAGAGVVSAARTHTERPASAAEAIAASWAEEDNRMNDGWNLS